MNDSNYDRAYFRIKDFFNNEIKLYILSDINNLLEIKPDKQGNGNCSIPLAMFILALIDLFGYLLRPDKDAYKENTKRNFSYLLSESKYFPDIYMLKYEIIYNLFRNGLMHQVFPKACGIIKNNTISSLFVSNDTTVLNIVTLTNDFIKALKKIEYDVLTKKDKQLIIRINKRLDILSRDDYDDKAILIKNESLSNSKRL